MHFYTIDDIAKELHMSVGTVRNRLSRGDPMPPSVKVGKKRLFPEDSFREWVQGKIESNDRSANGRKF